MPQPLRGTIQHRLPLSRKRPPEPVLEEGLFFRDHNAHAFLLIIPQRLLKAACDAARFQRKVCISRHAVVRLPFRDSREYVELLEVHGLEVDAQENTDADVSSTGCTLTLAEFQRKQSEYEKTPKRDKKEQYNLVATVDAISPILSVRADPFCLMELRDNAGHCCSAVIKGRDALICYSGMFPGDEIVLRVRRQKWHVAAELVQSGLVGRVPSYCFVVDQRDSVLSWKPGETLLPSAPTPLLSIQGRIEFVQLIQTHGGRRKIHYVQLRGEEEGCSNMYVLFLTHYPMSSSLQTGLRLGALVQAVNVHQVGPRTLQGKWNFGTCLRSSLSILETASEDSLSRLENPGTTSRHEAHHKALLFLDEVATSDLGSEPCSNAEYVLREEISEWLVTNWFQVSNEEIPPRSKLSRTLLEACSSDSVQLKTSDATTNKSRRRRRNPYVEFFDHVVEVAAGEKIKVTRGCPLSSVDRSGFRWPHLFGLECIRKTAMRILIRKLKTFLQLPATERRKATTFLNSGWTCSLHLSEETILQEVGCSSEVGQMERGTKLFTGGRIQSLENGSPVGICSDGRCQIPISLPATVLPGSGQTWCAGEFGFGEVTAAVVSCLCIGASKSTHASAATGSVKDCGTDEVQLPPYRRGGAISDDEEKSKGSCSLLQVDGLLFVASIQLRCASFLSIDRPVKAAEPERVIKFRTIQECLDPSNSTTSSGSERVVGMLVRNRYKMQKARNGVYRGYVLTASHVTRGQDGNQIQRDGEVSTLQSIDVRVEVDVDLGKMGILQLSVSQLGLKTLVGDQLAAVLAWWRLSDGRNCAVLSGGWDEFIQGEKSATTGVLLQLPCTAVSQVPSGYVRIHCGIDQIQTCYTEIRTNSTCMELQRVPFHFLGGLKFLPGMLDRRPKRKICRGCIGEMWSTNLSGIQVSTIGGIFEEICARLRQKQRVLSASLVRGILGATFLGVSFCRAQAECSTCFSPLRSPAKGKSRHNSDSFDEGEAQQTFWHRPGPEDTVREKQEQERAPALKSRRTLLTCPNNCQGPGTIKWECSGDLDDSTGQAKLYAERQTALLLLAFSTKEREIIEDGAWKAENGVVFLKSVPPKPVVRRAVEKRALSDCRRNAFESLPAQVQSEYLMQRHCRSSLHIRHMNCFVRCKPLPDDPHLSHTMVDVTLPGKNDLLTQKTPSYTLPPLKLVLVDCGSPASTVDDSWARIIKLKAR